MKKTLVCCALALCAAMGAKAQTSATVPFLALMQAQNEVPALNDTSNGNVIVWLHGVIDSAGKVISGSVDFDISTRFSGAVTVTGLHIHTGAAGVSGGIVIPTDVNANDKSVSVDSTGRVRIQKQVQFPSAAVSLDTINALVANPQNFYVNIHTSVNTGGAMRGQLMRAETRLLMGLMSTKNEVPAVNANGSAVGSVAVLRALDPSGNVALATAIFNVDYAGVDAGTTFTGLHIHNEVAGKNGGVVINTGLSGTNTAAADPSGSGTLTFVVPMSPLDATWNAEVGTVNGLFTNPSNHYINIHTSQFTGGIMRDQMRNTERLEFNVNMKPENETPPIANLLANAYASIPVFVLRNADGSIAAGLVVYDVNFRGFPAATPFTGLHIHRGNAGASGGIVIQSGVDANAGRIVSDTGSGNIMKFINVSAKDPVTALNDLVANPNGFYVNLHTATNGGGAVREQLAPALAKPTVAGVANNASTITTVAPGAVISIYGSNLSPVSSDLSGFDNITSLATSINGVTVTIGGMKAPFYYAGPQQINVQVPFEVPAGQQQVVVTNSAGASASFAVTVAAVAPSIFVIDTAGTSAVVKLPDYSLVTAQNRAKAGDTLVIFSTGLGQTTPAVQTGVPVVPLSSGFNNTPTVTVTMGGVNAPVIASVASPGFAGLYQTAITVPAGLTGPTVPLILRSGSAASNTVNIAVQ